MAEELQEMQAEVETHITLAEVAEVVVHQAVLLVMELLVPERVHGLMGDDPVLD